MTTKNNQSKPEKITAKKAEEMIAEIDSNKNSKLGVIKLGKFYYDITNCKEEDVLDFIKEHNRRVINSPKFGVTKV